MTAYNEETMALNLNLFETRQHNKIEKCIHMDHNIKTINRMGPYGKVSLHFATRYGSNEILQVLLTNSALKSFENISHESSSYDEIKQLFEKTSNLFDSNEEIQDYDYIEWSLIGDNLIKKREEFREQIDLYKTYDNRHHLIRKLLIEIIEYYISEYLIQQEHFSRDETNKLEFYFKKAIEEQNYLEYFIKVYTLTNNFYRVLNKHLALYILDYFDASSYSSSSTKYRLINCLVHIVTLLINHPDLHKYQYRGIAYRGLSMTENDLKNYSIGNHILNRSFVSASKSRSIAQIFANNSQETSAKISVLIKYTIKQNQTAIDIEHVSTIQDEEEVLILPFSVFQVKDRIENNPNMSPPVLVELDLEECEDNQRIDKKKHISKPLTNIRYRTKKRNNFIGLKYLFACIVSLFIIFILIMAVRLTIKNKTISSNQPHLEEEKPSKGRCPKIINRSIWNATKPKNYTTLSTPVPYVAILHTTGEQCKTLDSCISLIQYWQRFHMNTKEWDDIGYNFLVGGNGYVFKGRGWNYTGSHCKLFNQQSIGIGIIGDFASIQPPKLYVNAVHSLINCGILSRFIQKNYTLVGHWGFGIVESFMVGLNKSHQSVQYCSLPTTVVPN